MMPFLMPVVRGGGIVLMVVAMVMTMVVVAMVMLFSMPVDMA